MQTESLKRNQSRAEQELETLYRISQAMAHQLGISDLLDNVLDILETEMGRLDTYYLASQRVLETTSGYHAL